ncbi:MAG TPA: dihydrolipoyl dehydrogenase [Candidatus Acidoferrum sp.]|nr:dihydrolipoyl dehydrogenase [Candidatus Acidoferrum sp.]
MPDTIYDVAIIGSGPGGYTAAIRAGEYGLRAALIEKDPKLGGTCLHVGCIPTKSLLFDAELYDHFKAAKEHGIENVEGMKVNWGTIQDRKNKIVTKHAKGLEFLMRKNKVTTIPGYGRLSGPVKNGLLDIELTGGDGKKSKLQAKNVIIATGSQARMLPGLKPDSTVLTNIEILSLNTIPKSLIIIGSGAVGVEFASIYKSYGTDVNVIEALPRLVPVEDEDVSKELLRVYKKRGIGCHLGAKVDKVEKTKDGASVAFTTADGKQQKLEAEKVLIAIGRAPQTEDIGLDKTKIKAERGFIPTNEWMQTAEPCIYAIGDIVVGMPQLAHVAAMQGMVAVAKIAGKYARPVKRNLIPGATYCEPQIGSVGLTEAQARDKGYKVKIGKFPFTANSKASIISSHDGFIKVASEEQYGEILGVHIIGPSATELISEAVTAMQLEATVEEMMFTVHAHPTLYEALLDGFSSVEGKAINI